MKKQIPAVGNFLSMICKNVEDACPLRKEGILSPNIYRNIENTVS
jgi:hypothetical protein